MPRVELLGAALLFTTTLALVPAADAQAAAGCGTRLSDWQGATYTGILTGEDGGLHSVTVRIPGDTVTVMTDTHSWEARDMAVELHDDTVTWGSSVPDRGFTQTLRTPLCANGSTAVVAAEFTAERNTLAGGSTAFGWIVRTSDGPSTTTA
ncbi:hypothetical protein [Nocardia sp. NPDC051570]|uniref:hypothetical protein n=1 Tax=Nocardia sp. NPDC051570 TaxID=3364324 RepID=UPI0037967B35